MNEPLSPPEPEPPKPPSSAFKPEPPPDPPNFWAMLGLGVALNIVTLLVCLPAQSPMPFIFAALGAFISVFFRGYRGIFVGFVGTFGVILLSIVIYCSNHPFMG
jgi:hypothetical protein